MPGYDSWIVGDKPYVSLHLFGGILHSARSNLDGLFRLLCGAVFNPDLEANPPANIATYLRAIAEADELIIASPEYAHGVTGTIKKNALDWLVSFEPFAAKCVAVFNTSPRAYHAELALRETLKTMAAVIVEEASISIALLGANLDESAIVTDPAIASMIRRSLRALKHAVIRLRDPRAAQILTTW